MVTMPTHLSCNLYGTVAQAGADEPPVDCDMSPMSNPLQPISPYLWRLQDCYPGSSRRVKRCMSQMWEDIGLTFIQQHKLYTPGALVDRWYHQVWCNPPSNMPPVLWGGFHQTVWWRKPSPSKLPLLRRCATNYFLQWLEITWQNTWSLPSFQICCWG